MIKEKCYIINYINRFLKKLDKYNINYNIKKINFILEMRLKYVEHMILKIICFLNYFYNLRII